MLSTNRASPNSPSPAGAISKAPAFTWTAASSEQIFLPGFPDGVKKTENNGDGFAGLLGRVAGSRQADNDFRWLLFRFGHGGEGSRKGGTDGIWAPDEAGGSGGIMLQGVSDDNLLLVAGQPGFGVGIDAPRILPKKNDHVVLVALKLTFQNLDMAAWRLLPALYIGELLTTHEKHVFAVGFEIGYWIGRHFDPGDQLKMRLHGDQKPGNGKWCHRFRTDPTSDDQRSHGGLLGTGTTDVEVGDQFFPDSRLGIAVSQNQCLGLGDEFPQRSDEAFHVLLARFETSFDLKVGDGIHGGGSGPVGICRHRVSTTIKRGDKKVGTSTGCASSFPAPALGKPETLCPRQLPEEGQVRPLLPGG